jgi:hypothetical protein
MTFELARAAEAIARTRERMFRLAVQQKQFIPLGPAQEHIYRAFVGFRKQMESVPARHAAIIAAKLGCVVGARTRIAQSNKGNTYGNVCSGGAGVRAMSEPTIVEYVTEM